MTNETPLNVYQAISKVQAGLAKEGISKDRKNEQQGYKFRGIDDIYNALSGLLAENGLCILPRVLSRDLRERVSVKEFNGQRKETALFYVVVDVEYDFVSAHDGSKHTVRVLGEAMDSGDKATNKAMSAAYKYACLQAFSIPTEGDNDADATTHEVAASGKTTTPAKKETAKARNDRWEEIKAEILGCQSMDQLKAIWSKRFAEIEGFGGELTDNLVRYKDEMKTALESGEAMVAGFGQGFSETR